MSNTTENKDIDINKPKLVIPKIIYEQIMFWVLRAGSKECSGLGIVEVGDGELRVLDVAMCKQKNSPGDTDLDPEGIGKLMFRYKDHDGPVFWWHSHAGMSCFWSGTDSATMREIGGEGMCVAAVFNNKREVRAAVSWAMKTPFSTTETSMTLDNLKVEVDLCIPQELKDSWSKEFDDCVVKEPERSPYLTDHYYNGLFEHNITKASELEKKQRDEDYKRVWAKNRSAVIDYYPILNKFRLENNKCVDCDKYMKMVEELEECKQYMTDEEILVEYKEELSRIEGSMCGAN